jgi:hypothetical protein
VAAGITTAVLAAIVIGIITVGAARLAPISQGAFVHSYDHRVLHDGLEILLIQSDGQAFATLARDPSLSRPDDFTSRGEAAYRAQRPLLSYLAWMGSFGRSGWVPPALAILFVLAVAAAATGLATLLERRRCNPWLAVGLLLLPGTYASLEYFGPEVLGLALVVWGLIAWTPPTNRRTVVAVVLFALAGLARETYLLVPAVLALVALPQRRFRDTAMLAASALPWVAWLVVVHARFGAWPTDSGQGSLGSANPALTAVPFEGLVGALRHAPLGTVAPYAVVGALLALLAFINRDDVLSKVVLMFGAFAAFLSEYVWSNWQFFARVLLPLYALGFVVLFGRVLTSESSPAAAVEES